MRLVATIDAAKRLAPDMWQADLRRAPLPGNAAGIRRDCPTVLLARVLLFEPNQGRLSFDYDTVEVLARGDDARAIILAKASAEGEEPAEEAPSGDQAYLSLLETLSPAIRDAGQNLLERIRELDPTGWLERRGRRFINRPDNFVALEPQTTLNQIIVHLRGIVATELPPVVAQRGYSAFKVSGPSDLLQAGSALGRATRRF